MKTSALAAVTFALLSSTLFACGVSAPKESELKFNIAWSTKQQLGALAKQNVSMAADGSFVAVAQDDEAGEYISLQRYSSAKETTFSKTLTTGNGVGAVAAAQDGSTYLTIDVTNASALEKLDATGVDIWDVHDQDVVGASTMREIDSGSIAGFSPPPGGVGGTFFAVTPDGKIDFKVPTQIPWDAPVAISHDGQLATSMPCLDGSGLQCVYTFDSTGAELEWVRTATFGIGVIAWTVDGGLVLGAGTSTQTSVLDVLGLQFDSTSFQTFIVRLAPSSAAMWVEPTVGTPVAIDASSGQITVGCALDNDGADTNVNTIVGYSLEGAAGPSLASNMIVTTITGGEEGRVVVSGFLTGILSDGTETITGTDASVLVELALH